MLSIIIPTYQAEKELPPLLESLRIQTLYPHFEVLVVDSSSSDATLALARDFGAKVMSIPRAEFNHGLTRTLAGQKAQGDLLVYLTQDARLAHKEALERLLAPLEDPRIAAAYGRQIAPKDKGLLSALHRAFNYPPQSRIISYADRHTLGLRAVFASNSFAAYKREALAQVGWFPALPSSEDMYVFAKILKQGFQVAYVAEARVFHAHRLRLREEFKRYAAIGAFHALHPWIIEEFGQAQGEGWKYLRFMSSQLLKRAPHYLPYFFWQTLIRYLGYHWGKHSFRLKRLLTPKGNLTAIGLF